MVQNVTFMSPKEGRLSHHSFAVTDVGLLCKVAAVFLRIWIISCPQQAPFLILVHL